MYQAHKLEMKRIKKIKAPKDVKGQKSRAKTGCNFFQKTISKILVPDEESYFPMDSAHVATYYIFNATGRKNAKYDHKVIPKAKF